MSSDNSNNDDPSSKLPSRKSIPPFEALRAFDAVARLGGIRKAAQALYRDHAVVSRHLRTIEDWTGTKLIERTPAGAMLTDDGRRYHQQIKKSIDGIADATVDLIKSNKENCLQTWCMPAFAMHWLIAHLSSFEAVNPELDIELRSTLEEPDFNRQEADVNILLVPTFGSEYKLPANVRHVEIVRPPIIPVASPEYLEGADAIKQPSDLLEHQLLHEEDFDNWRLWFAEYGIDECELSGPRLWDGLMTLAAAKQGQGIAITNRLVVAEDLSQGRLLDVSAGNKTFKPINLWAYWFVARADRWNTAPIKRFRNWLLDKVTKELAQIERGS